jgi:lipid A oxidase
VGAGISVPHVEEQRTGIFANKKTFEYQYGGPVLTGLAGFKYPLNDRWDLLTELHVHYMMLDVKVDGGRLKTNLVTNALNLGVSYRF